MKFVKTVSALLCACMLSVPFFSIPISAEKSVTEASFLGCAAIFAPADSATVRFEIVSCGSSIQKAQLANQGLSERISAAIAAFGTPICEGYRTCESFSGSRFLVTRCLALNTSRVEELDAICQALIDAGASSLLEVSYQCNDLSLYEEEAMRLSLNDAKRKAEALGITLDLTEIQDLGCYACGFATSAWNGTPAVRVECSLRICYRAP